MRKSVGALLVIVAVLSSPAIAADPWTSADSAREATYVAVTLIDYAQTRYIALHPDRFFERNKFLGEHPSVGRVNTYFASAITTHVLIAHALPAGWRQAWQYAGIAVGLKYVTSNRRIGIRCDWPF